MTDEVQAKPFSCPAGAYVYVTYTANWDGASPTEMAGIEIELERYPVMGFVFYQGGHPREDTDVRALYLDRWVQEGFRTPTDWGEEAVALGVYPVGYPEVDLIEVAKQLCWHRCGRRDRDSAQER